MSKGLSVIGGFSGGSVGHTLCETPGLRVGATADHAVHSRAKATPTSSNASEKVDPTGAKGLKGFVSNQMPRCIVRDVVSSSEAADVRQVPPEVVALDLGSGTKLTNRNLCESYRSDQIRAVRPRERWKDKKKETAEPGSPHWQPPSIQRSRSIQLESRGITALV